MNGDKALDFLSPYGRQPSIAYLEWLINETNNAVGQGLIVLIPPNWLPMQDARHHTHLAVLYLDELLALAGGPQGIAALETSFKRLWPRPSFLLYLASLQHDPVAQARTKLLHFLQSSGHVRTASFLAKLATVGEMVAEKAVVLAKVSPRECCRLKNGIMSIPTQSGDYDRSLKLLVHDLCDYVGAEALCTALVRDSSSSRTANNPFTSLYHLYLDIPDDRYRTEQILRLLGNSRNTATVSDVIGSLPADWGLALAIPYLQRALRADEHAMRWGAIERQLSKVQNLRVGTCKSTRLVLGLTPCHPTRHPVRRPTLFDPFLPLYFESISTVQCVRNPFCSLYSYVDKTGFSISTVRTSAELSTPPIVIVGDLILLHT